MKKIFLIILIFPFIFGCAEVRNWTLESSQENLANAAVSRQVSKEWMSTWSLNSGAIQCGMKEFLPVPIIEDLKKMDELVTEQGLWSAEDYRLGCFEGLGIKLTSKAVEQAIKEIMGLIATFAK